MAQINKTRDLKIVDQNKLYILIVYKVKIKPTHLTKEIGNVCLVRFRCYYD